MNVIAVRNPHQGLPVILNELANVGVKMPSRNGDVLRFPGPTCIYYDQPKERVVFWPERDANPTFHLMESLWMLSGRNDVEGVAQYVKSMSNFSDDGVTFNGAYGHRWRKHFDIDQLATIVKALRENPNCRRQVLSMWDAQRDLGLNSKDLPCNTHIYFEVFNDKLNMTVCNRSNDIVWGALGANVVHMSMLQEFMAHFIGVEVGGYWQMSNNMHLYLEVHGDLLRNLSLLAENQEYKRQCPYEQGDVEPSPIVMGHCTMDQWSFVAHETINGTPPMGAKDRFFKRVVNPLNEAYIHYKTDKNKVTKYTGAMTTADDCIARDWRLAAMQWYMRRSQK